MKTKELIRRLNEADPSGEEHCCIQNADIWSVMEEPAYYDGALHIIDVRDEDDRPLKGHRQRSGKKINIEPINIQTAIRYGDFTVEYTNEEDRKRYEKSDLDCLREDKEIEFRVEREIFCSWVFLKMQAIKPVALGWVERIKAAAEKFYDEHHGPDVDGLAIAARKWPNSSHATKLEEVWEEAVHVDWDCYSRIILEMKPRVTLTSALAKD